MPIFINTNVAAMNAQRNLGVTNSKMARALERLSSGLRVNRAADDAAGLAISEKMRAQIRGLNQGLRNAQDGISLIQTTEGALNEVHSILQRVRELTTQAGSTILSAADRQVVGEEILTLKSEIDNIATRARFNGLSLLTGALSVSTTSTIADIADTDADGASVTIDVASAESAVTYTLTNPSGTSVTLTNGTTNVAQTLTAASMGDDSTQTLDFTALGVKLTLTENAATFVDGLTAAENRWRPGEQDDRQQRQRLRHLPGWRPGRRQRLRLVRRHASGRARRRWRQRHRRPDHRQPLRLDGDEGEHAAERGRQPRSGRSRPSARSSVRRRTRWSRR